MVGSVIHEYIVRSIIQHYGNLEATLSTPQYGFDKGLNVFKEVSYNATMKGLDKNLIGKNVIDMLPARSIINEMIKMSLDYLMFLKRKRYGKIKARACGDGRSQREYITKLESSSPCVKIRALFLSCLLMHSKGRRGLLRTSREQSYQPIGQLMRLIVGFNSKL